jgi:hypothetical protein
MHYELAANRVCPASVKEHRNNESLMIWTDACRGAGRCMGRHSCMGLLCAYICVFSRAHSNAGVAHCGEQAHQVWRDCGPT